MATTADAPLQYVTDPVDELEFWLLVEPGDASEVHWWQHTCWRCSAVMVVWWCATTPPWSQSRPEQEPLVIAAVRSDAEGFAPLAYLEFRRTIPRPNGYPAFCCPQCRMHSGDFYLYEEFRKLKLLGQTHIVNVHI